MRLYDSGVVVGMITMLEDGTWTITTSTLSSGNHTLTVTESNPVNGFASASCTALPIARRLWTLSPTTAPSSTGCLASVARTTASWTRINSASRG